MVYNNGIMVNKTTGCEGGKEKIKIFFLYSYIETSTRLKSRDSRTCKQAHLKSNSSLTVAGGPLQV
jgi:hypothetical protein